jgi:hypothetical protein
LRRIGAKAVIASISTSEAQRSILLAYLTLELIFATAPAFRLLVAQQSFVALIA